jgi:hypothetical protein
MEFVRNEEGTEKPFRYEAVSRVHFDDRRAFQGVPYLSLFADYEEWQAKKKFKVIWLSVCDEDGIKVDALYAVEPEQFEDALHETLNWMKDQEDGVMSYHDFRHDLSGYFPNLGCDRIFTARGHFFSKDGKKTKHRAAQVEKNGEKYE